MRSVVVHRHHSPSGLGNLMQRLTNTDYRRVPWKNGLGSTLELASDATTPGGPWTWRFSLADVPSRAAFSHFPGINRHLAVLDGQGMTVDRDGAHIMIPREGVAFEFAGEDDIVGEPLGADVRDVNLMVDRWVWNGRLEILRGLDQSLGCCSGEVILLYAAELATPLSVSCATEVHVTNSSIPFELHNGDTLVTRGPIELGVVRGSFTLIVATLTRAVHKRIDT